MLLAKWQAINSFKVMYHVSHFSISNDTHEATNARACYSMEHIKTWKVTEETYKREST